MAGFTFNGIHSISLGCYYHPDAKARGDRMAEYSVKELTDESRDGGYYLGARVEPRTFALDCYFEDITAEQQARIRQWLRRDTRGELIFDARPFAIYDVVTSKKPEIALYDHTGTDGIRRHSGTFTAHFTAHDPFAEMSQKSYTGTCEEAALNETGILPTSMMPESPSADGDFFLLYNPGTERAHTIIRITGDVGDGLTIRNLTTGQQCKIVNLTSASLLEGACLELDSRMGQTRIVLGDETEMAFAFHDEGYIDLAPCSPFMRSVAVAYTAGSNVITSAGCFEKRMKGQYIYINGWKKISQINDTNTAIISQAMSVGGSTDTPIVTMNEIEVQGDNAHLTKLEIDYTPRVE